LRSAGAAIFGCAKRIANRAPWRPGSDRRPSPQSSHSKGLLAPASALLSAALLLSAAELDGAGFRRLNRLFLGLIRGWSFVGPGRDPWPKSRARRRVARRLVSRSESWDEFTPADAKGDGNFSWAANGAKFCRRPGLWSTAPRTYQILMKKDSNSRPAMKALLCENYGRPETLRLVDLPDPVPGEGEIPR